MCWDGWTTSNLRPTHFGPLFRYSVPARSGHILAAWTEVLGIYNLFFEANADIPVQTQAILRLIGQLLGLALHNARIERERLRMTVMRERQEMVNEVHDAIAQTLAYVKMRLPLLNDAMLAHDDPRSLKYFSDVKKAVGEVCMTTCAKSYHLLSYSHGPAGLVACTQRHCRGVF